MKSDSSDFIVEINNATSVLRAGGVIAYPTEYCFGLGCDPRKESAINKLLAIKQRRQEQGVILIAADLDQVRQYADLNAINQFEAVSSSWPGPNTWLLPALSTVPGFVKGRHSTIAMRIPDHPFCLQLLTQFGHPIVSTSANRHGLPEHLSAGSLMQDIGVECDYVVSLPVGGASQASIIRDSLTGKRIR